MLFSKNKALSQDDLLTFEERFTKLSKQISGIDERVLDLEAGYSALRNKVLRKIQQQNKETSSLEDIDTTKPVLIAGVSLKNRNR